MSTPTELVFVGANLCVRPQIRYNQKSCKPFILWLIKFVIVRQHFRHYPCLYVILVVLIYLEKFLAYHEK